MNNKIFYCGMIIVCLFLFGTPVFASSVTEASTFAAINGDGNSSHDFKVIDEFKDEADLGGGQKMYRIYSSPRLVEKKVDGTLKLRPKGWNLFNERAASKFIKSVKSGYEYSVDVLGKGGSVKILAGEMTFGKTTQLPISPKLEQQTIDNQNVSILKDVYPGVDIQFVDVGQSRQKNILIRQAPTGITSNDVLTFWENIQLGKNANAYLANGTLITGDQDITQKGLYIKDVAGNRINISTAIASDSSGRPFEFVENPNLYIPKQIVKLDRKTRVLKIGLQIDGKYLLSKERVYPVIVDPTYYGCSEIVANNMTCTLNNFFLRAKNGGSDSFTICNPQGNCDTNSANNQRLFVGNYLSGGSYYTRHALLYFNLPQLSSLGAVQSATLNMYYNIGGSGSASSASVKAKQLASAPDPATIPSGQSNAYSYATARSNISANDSAATVNLTPASMWYAWYITNTVKNWYNNPTGRFALIVENADNWPSGSTPPASWSNRLFIFMSKEYTTDSSPNIQIVTADPLPDLTLDSSDAQVNKYTTYPGDTISIGVPVKNIGTVAPGKSSYVYYYFRKDTCDSSIYNNSYKVGQSIISNLFPGSVYPTGLNYTIPAGTQLGDYCLAFWIDGGQEVAESLETNNKYNFIQKITVTAAPQADLSIYDNTLTSTSVKPGDTITAKSRIVNAGTGNSGSSYVGYYYSADGSCSSVSNQFLNDNSIPSLASGDISSWVSNSITIPMGASPGTRYVCFIADYKNNISESNESNNKSSVGITVSNPYDFSVSNASILTSGSINSNNTKLQVQVKIKNTGNSSANGVNYTLRLKSGDFQLTNLSSLNIPANSDQYYTLTGYVQDSCSMPAEANYQVEINIDPNNDFDTNSNIITTSNSIHIDRYSYCGGGGGNPGNPPPDADSDGFSDAEEGFSGTSVIVADAKKIYDPINVKNYTAKKTDKQTNAYSADPVNIRTGAFEFNQTDFALRGRGLPIDFTRAYNSKLMERDGKYGRGWNISYNSYYFQDETTKNVEVYLGGALVSLFTTTDGGLTFLPSPGEYDSLINDNGTLVYKTLDGIRYVYSKIVSNHIGVLEQIKDTNDNVTTLSYSTVRDLPLLTTITDASGRGLQITYGDSNNEEMWDKITKIQENANPAAPRVVNYEYDANGDLIHLQENNSYNGNTDLIDKYFAYDANGRLLSYTDPRGTILYNTYDTEGRVTQQYEYNPNVDSVGQKRLVYELAYSGANADAPGSAHCATVKNYRDAGNHYDETTCFNSGELKIYLNKAGNVERWSYNVDGMPAQYTNQNGNVYNYEYDAKRRMTKEILPDANGWHTEKALSYENNFNRLTQETVTAAKASSPTLTQTKKYTINATNGNVTSIEDPVGFTESFTYDSYGNVLTHTDKNGNTSSFIYDAGGNYQTQQSIADVVKKFEYDAYGNVKKYTDPRGFIYLYEYDTRNNLRKETDAMSGVKSYTYDKEDHRLTAADELGRVTTYTYDKDINASLLKIEKQNAGGSVVSQREYDWLGNLKKETDPLGREIIYTYNSANRIIAKQSPYNTIDYTYDGVGNVESEVNSLAQKITYAYDARSSQISVKRYLTDTEFVIQTKEFDGLSRVVKSTDGNGGETRYQYDNNNRLIKIIDPIGAEIRYAYDNNGNKIEEIDALNRSTHYQYDALNRLIKQTNALDKETKYYYDASSNLIKVIDRQDNNGANNNHVTEYIYDNLNRKTQEKDAYGAIVAFVYDAVGNLTSKTDQLSRVWTYVYDDLNRLTSEKDPANNTTTHAYDKVGNELSVIYAGGKKTSFVYDDANRLIQTKDALNNSRSYQYDAVGNKTKETDKLGHATNFVYDKLNRLTQETNNQNTIVNYTYDSSNNRLTENVAGKLKTFVYDANNRLTGVTNPGGDKESFSYDISGNAISKTNGNNETINYTYDALNRVTQKSLPEGQTVVYTYDNWNNLTSVKGDNNDAIYAYNLNNQQTSETQVLPGLAQDFSITRAYNAAQQLTSLTDAKGVIVNYEYDNRGLLSTVKNGTQNLASYSYTSFNKPQALTYSNGLATNYEYDELHRTKKIEVLNGAVSLWKQEYNYDAENNRTQLTENGTRVVTYGYDNLDQITSVKYPDTSGSGEIKFDYDTWGNRKSLNSQLGVTNYTYAADSDKLQNYKINNRLQVNLQYDNNGSLTQEVYQRLGKNIRAVDYSWDSQNRLQQITYQSTDRPAYMPILPSNLMQFVYDDAGNRVKKTVNGKSTYYLNDGLRVLNEIDQAGAVDKTIVYGLEQVAEIKKDGTIQFIHSDVLGSTVLITDQTGAVKQEYEYDVFGSIIGKNGLDETNYLFTNQEYDSESELYYYNARYYNPAIGRFISRDPMPGRDGDVISRNSYVYVKNNPLKYVDPMGREELFCSAVSSEGYTNNDKTFGLWQAIPTGVGMINFIDAPVSVKGTKYTWSMNPPSSYKGESTSPFQLYKTANNNKGLRLDYGENVKAGGTDWHWNQKGTFEDFGIVDHAPVGPGMETLGTVMKITKVVSKPLLVVGATVDVYNIYAAEDKVKETTKVAGGWVGAYAGGIVGAETGAAAGAGIGVFFGGVGAAPGAAVGGFIGGVAGSIGGYFAGSEIGNGAYNFVSDLLK